MRERRARRNEPRRDIGLAAAYHNELPEDARGAALGDRTWKDLNFDEVFLSVDRTVSQPGRQYLYHLLRTPTQSRKPLERLEQAVQLFTREAPLADRVRGALSRLADFRAEHLVRLVLGELPRRPRLWWLFPLLTAGSLVCLALIGVWPRAFIVWVAICVVNVGVQIVYKSRLKRFVPALHELPAFIRAAQTIGELASTAIVEETRCLRHGAKRMSILRRATLWLMFEPGQTNELASSAYEYVNLLLLLDMNAFVFALESLRGSQQLNRQMFEAIGFIDAAQSIAAWRATLPRWSAPTFVGARKSLSAEALVHPLVADAVSNSIDVEGTSLLITGSNMSGKTTFVRALGVNAILAQTLHTVCARGWRAPMLHVRTSIERTDSITEGQSYYLAELDSVRALVNAKSNDAQHLFLMDEIFRGTNTTERIAAASAVLRYLDQGLDLVVVATHDIEMLDLVGDAYTPFHFREQIVDGALTFDYLIHGGPSSTRNAIALLGVMKFPTSLVDDAIATLDWQSRRQSGIHSSDA